MVISPRCPSTEWLLRSMCCALCRRGGHSTTSLRCSLPSDHACVQVPPPFTYLRSTLDPCLYRTHHLHPSTARLCVCTFLHTYLKFKETTHGNEFFVQAPCCSPLFCPRRLCCTNRAQLLARTEASVFFSDANVFSAGPHEGLVRQFRRGYQLVLVSPPTQVPKPMLPTSGGGQGSC